MAPDFRTLSTLSMFIKVLCNNVWRLVAKKYRSVKTIMHFYSNCVILELFLFTAETYNTYIDLNKRLFHI